MHLLLNSELFNELTIASKKIGNLPNPPLTAERFIVAIIDMINNGTSEKYQDELNEMAQEINKRTSDINKTRQSLIAYINEEKKPSFYDSLYMNKRVREASDFDKSTRKVEIQANTVLCFILFTPSDAIKSSFDIECNEKPQAINDDFSTYEEQLKRLIKIVDEEKTEGTSTTDTNKKADDGENNQESNSDSSNENPDANDTDVNKHQESLDDILSFISQLSDELEELENNDENNDGKDEEENKASPKPESKMSLLVSDVKKVRAQLLSLVYGQDNAINVFTTGYFQACMRAMTDKSRIKPLATYLFAGPPGVGKTFLAEESAKALGLPFMRFDMSEYADKEANLEFCGSDKVYKNAKAGNVTGFVAENPNCVLLFDEIEKAHLCVIHLFLQILDAGRVRDNYTDEEVSFKDTIIIFTTNAGKQIYGESESGDFSCVSRKVIIKALQQEKNPTTGAKYFPGAICSRFASGNVVMFNHMGAHHLRSIACKEIERLAKNVEDETGIKIQIDEKVYTALLLSEGSVADARTIKGRAETFFDDELYELLRLIASQKVKTRIDDIEKIQISVDLSQAKENIKGLFTPLVKPQVLAFASPNTVELCSSKAKEIDIIGAQDLKSAIEVLKTKDISFALIDMRYGMTSFSNMTLNLEDVDSLARELFKFLKENRSDLPVYLIEERGCNLSEEEKISFMRQGVRGTFCITKGKDSFAKQINQVSSNLYQQASMVKLAKENKLVSFETAQTVSKNGKIAQIKLFDFEMKVAVDSEDAKNILSAVSRPNVHFDDVIGAKDAKRELTYFVEYLKNPKKYMGTGVKAPKGILLYGPPGTGKTMLAKAMACESGVTFIAAEGNQFLKKYVGEGSERVHELFKAARKYAPSILFIDEIDAIAKERRGGSNSGATGEETLTAFLTEMDGFASDPTKPVFVLAATNFNAEPGTQKSLDPALVRRFDRHVYIDLPSKEDRIKFLKMKCERNRAIQLTEEQIDNIAVRSTGMSLADLDSVAELALRSAIREGSVVVDDAIFEEAFETFNSGDVKKWDDSTLERVARHEAGHALICYLSGETPYYLTVVARSNHGGYMQHADNEGKAIYTKEELLSRIRTSLGGRASEIVYYGEQDGISTGASGDLQSATSIAQQIVCTYGMDSEFGLAVVTHGADGDIATMIRACVNRILDEQMKKAIELISQNKNKIDSLVEELINKNHLNGVEIEQAIAKADKK